MTHPLRRALTRAAAPSAPRRAYLRALSSSALVAPFMLAPGLATAQTLPSGGKVVAGSATVGAPAGGKLKIDQSSSRAIIDWTDFSVGKGGAVTFNNGNGATLNRVTGRNISSLDGLISATGSVYLLNPNGVVIGKNGVVDVGGSFVASTLNLSNDAFMAGGDLALAGNSAAPVINLGRIGALGGDVVLAAMTVENKGKISSPTGTTGLLAGSSIVLSDQADDNGRFKVLVGGGGSSATNAGQIAAAAVELRANGGSIYALAGDTRGIINATGVTTKDGRVFLTAGTGGRIEVADSDISARAANGGGGTIIVGSADTGETRIGAATILDASATNGAGGFVETSAAKIQIADDARVKTRGANGGANGTWLIDPTDFVVAKNGGSITGAALSANLAANDVVIASSGAGVGGNGDVIFQDDVNWSSDHTLTVNSFRDILIRSQITATGGNAGLVFNPGLGGGGGSYKFQGGRITLSGATSSFQVNGLNYSLIRSLADLSMMSSTGVYALAGDIDASETSGLNQGQGFNPLANFSGTLEGFGHVIDGLYINRGGSNSVGLFGQIAVGGVVQNLGLSNASIVGGNNTGALAGQNHGTISNAYATGSVNGVSLVGGLVGYTTGAIDKSYSNAFVSGTGILGGLVGQASGANAILDNVYASGQVWGQGASAAGGLVGRADTGSIIRDAYATGAVSGATDVGGLVGQLNTSTVTKTYAAGTVAGSNVGGLVGASVSGNVSNSYWDSVSSGREQGWGTRTELSWLNSAALYQNNSFDQLAYKGFDFASTWVMIEGRTRPFLRSEWSTTIVNAHQLQLMTLNLSADYSLGADIDLTETALSRLTQSSGMWASAGFVAIGRNGSGANAFTGGLDGHGFAISNIFQNSGSDKSGLIAQLSGSVRNLGLAGGNILGTNYVGGLAGHATASAVVANVTSSINAQGFDKIGGLIGWNEGAVSGSSATGTVQGQNHIGGLIGTSAGTVTNSSAQATVKGAGIPRYLGGLIGSTTTGAVVSGSYFTGEVTAGDYIGGLIGHATGTTISNSYATGKVTGAGYLGGLVGYMAQGTVASSYAASIVTGADNDIGGLVGYALNSTFTDVRVEAGSKTAGTSRVGGLIGYLADSRSKVDNSEAMSDVSGRDDYGGLIGRNDGTIRNSSASGDVASRDRKSNGDLNAGGLVGYNTASGNIIGSSASGSVDGRAFVGGLAGTNRGLITASHASGNVIVHEIEEFSGPGTKEGGQGGGLVGANYNKITDSYATGNVTSLTAGFRMGGLVGVNETPAAEILNSYATGNVSSSKLENGVYILAGYQLGGLVGYQSWGAAIKNSYATGAVKGDDAIGGLVGASKDVTSTTPALIVNSYATGNVEGKNVVGGLVGGNIGSTITQSFSSSVVKGYSNVGGLVGQNSNNERSGLITQSYASGTVQGSLNVGGLVGFNNLGDIVNAYAIGAVTGAGAVGGLVGSNAGNIAYSYSSGNVTGPSSVNVGGLVGTFDNIRGTIVESYWDIGTSGRATSQGGTGKTTAEMLDPKTFRNWDIAAVWAPAGGGFRPELYGVSGVIGVYAGAFNRAYGEANTADLNANRTLVGAEYWNRLNGSIVGTFSTDTTQNSNAGLYYLIGSGGDTGMRVQGPNSGASARIVYAGTLNVGRRTLRVTANSFDRVYGGSDPDFTYTVGAAAGEGLVNNDSLTGGLMTLATQFSAVDAYDILNGGLDIINLAGQSVLSNYDLQYTKGTLNVGRRTLRVTANSFDRVYGGSDPDFTYTVGAAAGEGLVNNDSLTGGLMTLATQFSAVDAYDILNGGLDIINLTGQSVLSNYDLQYTKGTLNVGRRTLRVTANSFDRVYGGSDPDFTYTVGAAAGEGLVNNDSLTGGLMTLATQFSAVDAYDILNGGLDIINLAGQSVLSNYDLQYTKGTLNVGRRTLRVTANSFDRVYGGSDPDFTYTVGAAAGEGLVNNDSLTGGLMTLATQFSAVDAYDILNGGLDIINLTGQSVLSNYDLQYTKGTLNVGRRTLRVTANSFDRVYGGSDPDFTYTVGAAAGEGLVNNDSLTGGLMTLATQFSAVDAYDILNGGLDIINLAGQSVLSNYDLQYTKGTLNVGRRTLRVTANSFDRVYGGSDPDFTYTVGAAAGEGLVNNDSLTGGLMTLATQFSAVDAYDILNGGLDIINLAGQSVLSNYDLQYTKGTLNVGRRTLRVTANSFDRVYGGSDPDFTYTVGAAAGEGLVNNDSLTGGLMTLATQFSAVDAYDILNGGLDIINLAGQSVLSNYDLQYTKGTLNVGRRTLRVTANSFDRVYGGSDPDFTYTVGAAAGEGLVNNDSLTGGLMTLATQFSAVDAYDILNGGLDIINLTGQSVLSNYDLQYTKGTLNVGRRTLRVTANSFDRVYGGSDPDFTYTVGAAAGEGLVNNDSLTGGLMTLATQFSAVDAYDILNGGLDIINLAGQSVLSNYDLQYTKGTLNVGRRTLRVTANSFDRVYGGSDPDFTYTVGAAAGEGLVNNDSLTGGLMTLATQFSAVDAYDILNGGLDIINLAGQSVLSNYDLQYTKGTLNVGRRTLRVTANSFDRVYGGSDPDFTYTVGAAAGEGLVNNDSLTGGLMTLATQFSAVDAYDILNGGLDIINLAGQSVLSNYDLQYTKGTLNVGRRTLRVTANSFDRVYGGSDPDFTYTVGAAAGEGLVNNDSLTGGLMTLATQFSAVDAYDILNGGLDIINLTGQSVLSNYDLQYTKGTLNVGRRTLRVTANSFDRVYGGSDPDFTYTVGAAAGEGLVNNDSLTGGLMTLATQFSAVDAYDILNGGLDIINLTGQSVLSNYDLQYTKGTLNVGRRTLRVTANSFDRVYGGSDPDFTYTVGAAAGEGLVNNDSLTGGLMTLATQFSAVDAYDILNGGLDIINLTGQSVLSNYDLQYTKGTLNVGRRTLRVTANSFDRVYGGSDPDFTYTVGAAAGEGLVNNDSLTGGLMTLATQFSAVDAYDILDGGLDIINLAGQSVLGNYDLQYTKGTLNVGRRTLRVTALGGRSIYGDTAVDPGLTWEGLTSWDADRASDILAGLSNSFGIDARTQVGPHALTVLGNISDSNYQLETVDGRWVVDPRTVYVTARDLRRVYGDANPEALYDVAARVGSTGLLDGDRLIGSLLVDADVTDGVGFYNILLGDLRASSNNYVLDYTGAQLEITKRNVSVRANDLSRQYGDGNPALTWTAQGLVNGDTLGGSLATAADVTSGIGGYAIGLGSLGASNYNIDFTGATLTVTPRDLLVTANNLSRQYGDANPQLTWTADRLMNGDTLSGALATAASATSGIGNYDITVGTLAASPNYRLTFQGGQLTVTPRALIVTADNLSRIYGDANPALTWVAQGLVNDDTLSGALATVAGITSNVGAYGITQGTLAASSNYALTYVGGQLQVTPRALLVQANNQSRQIGEPNPALTWVAQGLVNGDTLSGALATNANAGSLPGGYAITRGSLSASSNYALAFTNGVLTVRPPASGAGDGDPFPDPSPTPLEAPDPGLLERNLKTLETDKRYTGIRIASSCPLQDDCLLVYPTNANAAYDVRLAAR